MRKFLLLLTLVFMSICKVNAQASGYTFSSSSGTYTAITGGTVIKDGSSTMDSYASGAITIPSFTFNGTSYTTAYATSNGFITLGGSAPSAYTSTGISSNTGSGIAICPMSADLDRANTNATTEMRWETVGDEVVFQWKQMKRYGQTENFDFQARLNTVSGVITFVYQLNSGPGTGTSYQPQVGIRTSTTDFKNRLVASGSETWATSLAGTLNNNTCRFTAASPAKSFTSGQTYTFTPPACFAPSSLSAGSVTKSSASISFAGAGSAFILEYGAPGFTPGTDNNPGVGGTIVTGSASPIAISGLTANTTYDVYIRQDCGGGIYSVNSTKVTFTTLCDAVTTYPYTEGFNSVGVIPSCWSVAEGSPGASYHWQAVAADATHGAGSAAEGAAFMRVNYYNASTTYNPYYLKSIPFDLGASAKRAKFSIWMGASSGTNNLKFQISTDGGTTWTTLDTYTANPANSSSSAPWDNGKIVDLSAYTNQTVIFRLNATSNFGSGFCNIGFDNFVVEDLPACAEPTALSAGSVTNNSASISFTGAGTAYILEYGAAGFTPGTDNNPGGGTIVTGSGSPIAITGLTNNTTYDVYIRQDCGGGVYSVNSTKVTFTTICAIPTALSAGSITTTSASISFTGSGSAYILEYGASGFTPGTDNNPGAGTIVTGSGSPIAMSGLTSSTIYDVYIRRDCGGGDYSANSAKLTFTTLCDAVTTYPYTEGFNASTLPVCWSVSEGSPGASQHWQPVTADATHGAGASAEGSHFLRMYYYLASGSYNPYYLKSGSFDLGASAKRAKFAIWMGAASGSNNLKFEISTDGGSTWTTLDTYTANPSNSSSSAPWDSKTVDLSSYTNQTVIFRLNATSNFGSGYCDIGFDNFVVEDLPACAEPTGLSAGSVTNNSASISFTGAGTAYILEYGAAGFTPGTDNNPGVGGTIVTGSGSPIAMSGLTSNTVYDVYIRQDCGGGIYSPNSTKVTFTTLCDATNVPYTQDFESATVPALPACTLMENVGAGNNWVTVSAPGNGFTTKALKYGYNDTEAANVWFYTQGINLTSGVAYTISYNYGNNSTTYAPEKLKVAYGTAASNGAMTNVLADHPNINQAALQSNTVVFTPSVTGVYYFGFNAYSDANMYNLYVDNITIDVAPWTWTGATDTDWGIASNWDLGSVPTATNSVVIPATANQPIIGATQSVKNIKVNAGATLTVNNTLNVKNVINSGAIIGSGTLLFNANEAQSLATGTGNVAIANLSVEGASTNLTVSGTSNLNIANVLTVQDGNTLITGGLVVLKSDATKTARIAPIGTGVITGNVVVERFIPAKATRKWSLLSSPVTQSLANSWQQQIHLTGA
ncbi:MAG: choice-of-anchor J domain-containing protein, partial [Chitinophagaceae bacterium]|nr:choice-of-anchor J domain-containing protein [Chitinophagaceae bacterium]